MKDLERLKKLLADHFDGNPWIEVNLKNTLEGIDATNAATNIGNLNSIWQILYHMIAWRETLLARINNQPVPSPANNYFERLTDTTDNAWTALKDRLRSSQEQLMKFTGESTLSMDEHPNEGEYTRFELLQGILQHDAYHLGQIVLLKKMLLEKMV